jgi:hypothetical protein
LPGVYALAQCWMQQGILGPFRQQSGAVSWEQQPHEPGDMDLAPWFDSLTVRLVILVSMTSAVQSCCALFTQQLFAELRTWLPLPVHDRLCTHCIVAHRHSTGSRLHSCNMGSFSHVLVPVLVLAAVCACVGVCRRLVHGCRCLPQ